MWMIENVRMLVNINESLYEDDKKMWIGVNM